MRQTSCHRCNMPFAIVCSLDSLLPLLPNGPFIRACASNRALATAQIHGGRGYSLAPCPTNEPWTMAAPALVSPKVTSFTIVFSSTTVPHLMQKPFPAAVSYSMTLPPQSLHVAWPHCWQSRSAKYYDRTSTDQHDCYLAVEYSGWFRCADSCGPLVMTQSESESRLESS